MKAPGRLNYHQKTNSKNFMDKSHTTNASGASPISDVVTENSKLTGGPETFKFGRMDDSIESDLVKHTIQNANDEDDKNQMFFHDNTFKVNNTKEEYSSKGTEKFMPSIKAQQPASKSDGTYVKFNEDFMISLKSSIDYFKTQVPGGFAMRENDKENALLELTEENEKLKQQVEDYFFKYKEMKDTCSSLKKKLSSVPQYDINTNQDFQRLNSKYRDLRHKYDEVGVENEKLRQEVYELRREVAQVKNTTRVRMTSEDKRSLTTGVNKKVSNKNLEMTMENKVSFKNASQFEELLKQQINVLKQICHVFGAEKHYSGITNSYDNVDIENIEPPDSEDELYFDESKNITNMSSNSIEEKENISLEKSDSLLNDRENKSSSMRIELPLSQFEKSNSSGNNIPNSTSRKHQAQSSQGYSLPQSQLNQYIQLQQSQEPEKNGADSSNNVRKKPKDYANIHSRDLFFKLKQKHSENEVKRKPGELSYTNRNPKK